MEFAWRGIESNELPTDAAIRETKKETGLDIIIKDLIGVYGNTKKNELVFAFVCQVVGGQRRLSDEADAFQYFSVDAIT